MKILTVFYLIISHEILHVTYHGNLFLFQVVLNLLLVKKYHLFWELKLLHLFDLSIGFYLMVL
jgi:hypothetical protein